MRNKISKLLQELTKDGRKSFFNSLIGFGYIFRNELFPSQRKKKLHPRGKDPYQVLERINNNAYKIDLPVEFSVYSTSMLLT